MKKKIADPMTTAVGIVGGIALAVQAFLGHALDPTLKHGLEYLVAGAIAIIGYHTAK